MRTVKPEVRILGVDDAAFDFEDERTELIGTMFRGGTYLEGVLKTDITVDGFDVTEKILEIVLDSRHKDQIQVAILDGITFGGFNIADINKIAADGDIAVLAVSRNKPDIANMENGLKHVEKAEKRREIIERTGTAEEHTAENGTIYFQYAGITAAQAHDVLNVATQRSLIPEPVRAAHLIAGALKNGESKNRV